MDTARGSSCSLCPGATTCKQGGDVFQCPAIESHICNNEYVVGARVKDFMMVQGLIQIEAAKTVSHFATTPMMGVALGRTVSSF